VPVYFIIWGEAEVQKGRGAETIFHMHCLRSSGLANGNITCRLLLYMYLGNSRLKLNMLYSWSSLI